MASVSVRTQRDYGKWTFFALLAVCTLAVIYAHTRFLFVPNDPHWTHIRPFQWFLLPHSLIGAVALFSGPLQFSDRLRASQPATHRMIGWFYVVAASITAVSGIYIGTHFGPPTIFVEEYFHGGLVLFTTGMALICIRNKNMAAHKLWMMRSYGVSLNFIFGRLPDIVNFKMSAQTLADVLWTGDILALIAPDLMLTARELYRRSARRSGTLG